MYCLRSAQPGQEWRRRGAARLLEDRLLQALEVAVRRVRAAADVEAVAPSRPAAGRPTQRLRALRTDRVADLRDRALDRGAETGPGRRQRESDERGEDHRILDVRLAILAGADSDEHAVDVGRHRTPQHDARP